MLMSKNPNGDIEVYTDIGQFIGILPPNYPGIDTNELAEDGGPGSGNFGHKGRPGQIGGSGEGGSGKAVRETKSGASLADELQKEYDSPDFSKMKFYGLKSVKRCQDKLVTDIYGWEDRSQEENRELYDHFLEVVKTNGDYRNHKKKPMYNARFGSDAEKKQILEECGFSDDEIKTVQAELERYTGKDYKNADQDILEKFIESRPKHFGSRMLRGIHLKKDEFDSMMREIETGVVSFGRISSWSNDYGVAEAFAKRDDDNIEIGDDEIPVIFEIPSDFNRTGVCISEFSKFREKEVITGKNTSWSVVAVKDTTFVGGKFFERRIKGVHIILMERGEEYDE